MPSQVRNRKSGALIFHSTPDEKERLDIKRENQVLKQQVLNIENKMKEMENFINTIRNKK